MVKNFGGKHGKKIARKNAHSNDEQRERRLRFAGGPEEKYGIVTKSLGNSQFLIMCDDQTERLCVLRNKFTGRNKQSNLIVVGSWVIIGLRNWETTKPGKKQKCDMLEVYSNSEKHKLLQECKQDFTFLSKHENILLNIEESQNENSDMITFSNNNNGNNESANDTVFSASIDTPIDDDLNDDEINFDEI